MKGLVLLVLVIAFLSAGVIAPEANATDMVTSIITCPSQVAGMVDFPVKIGKDPDFAINSRNNHERVTFTFLKMSHANQKITCLYSNKLEGGQYRTLEYSYTVERHIQSCEEAKPNQLKCLLKPN